MNFFECRYLQSYLVEKLMNFEDKSQLAMTGRHDKGAASVRVQAARKYIGASQKELADQISRNDTTIIAIEKARQLPSWDLMMWFYNNHRINVDYFVAGAFSQLPLDVQDGLFAALSERDKS